MDNTKWFCETGSECHTLKKEFVKTYNGKIYPATKEQRDLLFEEMQKKGYEWDAEKKELKKIHVIDEGKAEMDYCFTKMMNGEKVSSAWSEEDEKFFKTALWHISYSISNGESTDIHCDTTEWLKSLKDRVQPQPKYEWSEKDEHKIKDIIYFLDTAKKHYASTVELDACIDWLKYLKNRIIPQPTQEWSEEDNKWFESLIQTFEDGYLEGFNQLKSYGVISWLKSLKERYTWKPSDEQMKALHDLNLTGNISYAGQGQTLIELYNDLKKLTE